MNPIERRTRAAECRRCCTERDIPCRNKTATKQNLDLAIIGKMYSGAPIAAVRGSRLLCHEYSFDYAASGVRHV